MIARFVASPRVLVRKAEKVNSKTNIIMSDIIRIPTLQSKTRENNDDYYTNIPGHSFGIYPCVSAHETNTKPPSADDLIMGIG